MVVGQCERLQQVKVDQAVSILLQEDRTDTREGEAAADNGIRDTKAGGLCGVVDYVIFSADAVVRTMRPTSKDHISRTLLDRPQELHQSLR